MRAFWYTSFSSEEITGDNDGKLQRRLLRHGCRKITRTAGSTKILDEVSPKSKAMYGNQGPRGLPEGPTALLIRVGTLCT